MVNAMVELRAVQARRALSRHNAKRNARMAVIMGEVCNGLALLATVALIAALVALAHGASGDAYGPCAHEDSVNCYWDAKAQGNGEGQSFIDVGGKRYMIGMR